MTTPEEALEILRSVPVVQEKQNPGYLDFRVRDRIFAKYWSGAGLAILKVGSDEQGMLSLDATKYSIPNDGGRGGWISVNVNAMPAAEFEEVVWKAWRLTAGPTLSLQY